MENPKSPTPEDEVDPLDAAAKPEPAPPAPPPLEGDELDEDSVPAAEGRKLTDMLRKAMVAGLGAVFMTEEGIRTYVKDVKLPKDVMGFVIGQADRSKGELFRVIGDELHKFFESELLRREITRVLSQMTIEIHAEIRLKPDGTPEMKVRSTKAHRNKPKKAKKAKKS